ncbi:hypothetical protein GCM10025771_02280 [Niveibacterium umoris]|uniref:hypothetical protein n=1 Tax=Niveibacterium umoris TaxID=1193620 RepID=UPI001A90C3CE|nr:hypothetical protein [Niveibacterium umoris]
MGLSLVAAMSAAADGVVIVVRRDSPIGSLTRDEAYNLFVLDRRGTLAPFDLPETELARQALYQELAGRNVTMMRALRARLVFSGQGRPPQQVELEEMLQRLQADRNAIGYLPAGAVPDGLRILLTLGATR